MTLKHDRECNLELQVAPSNVVSIDETRIEIARRGNPIWHTLSTEKALAPWQANIAGYFNLRGTVTIAGMDFHSAEIGVQVQFPTYEQIVSDTGVISMTDAAWEATLDDCTEFPNRRRERGFWILLDTSLNIYLQGAVALGPWIGPSEMVGMTLPPRPNDTPAQPLPNAMGAIYPVASFHTHPPVTFLDDVYRLVGPSSTDNLSDLEAKVPGVVYDYIEAFSGTGIILAGHPKDAPAQRYLSLGCTRRETPQ